MNMGHRHEHQGHKTTRAEWQEAWERQQQRADDLQVELERLREYHDAVLDEYLTPEARERLRHAEIEADKRFLGLGEV